MKLVIIIPSRIAVTAFSNIAGQLIYSTAPLEPFHSSVAPERYNYQLFGYFLLLDDDWERHRRAIGFDVDTAA